MDGDDREFLEPIDLAGLKRLLPHRHPMLMVDRIVDVTPHDGAVGIKCVTNTEPYFPGHFPDYAVMPGVMIVEAMAQTAAAYTAYTEEIDTLGTVVLFMGIDKAKFRRPVVPGDRLELHVKVIHRRPPVWKYESRAVVDGKVVADAIFSAMQTAPKD